MPEQRADQRQARAAGDKLGGIGVAEIVNAQPLDASRPDALPPTRLDLDEMTARAIAGKNELRARTLAFANIREQSQRGRGERDLMVLLLLGRAWRLRPNAVLDVRPLHR